jgi:hypothetical protein
MGPITSNAMIKWAPNKPPPDWRSGEENVSADKERR